MGSSCYIILAYMATGALVAFVPHVRLNVEREIPSLFRAEATGMAEMLSRRQLKYRLLLLRGLLYLCYLAIWPYVAWLGYRLYAELRTHDRRIADARTRLSKLIQMILVWQLPDPHSLEPKSHVGLALEGNLLIGRLNQQLAMIGKKFEYAPEIAYKRIDDFWMDVSWDLGTYHEDWESHCGSGCPKEIPDHEVRRALEEKAAEIEVEKILRPLRQRADAGEPFANFLMGRCKALYIGAFDAGYSAQDYYRRAAEGGIAEAANELGVSIHRTKNWGPEEGCQVIEAYWWAVRSGLPEAYCNLALALCHYGNSKEQRRRVIELLEAAAQLGVAEGRELLEQVSCLG